VSQSELVRLRRLGRKASLQNMSEYLAEMAAEIAPHVVRLRGAEMSGVIWEGRGSIITAVSGSSLPDTVVVTGQGGARIPADTVVAAPDLPLALLQASSNRELSPIATRSMDELMMGEWLLAVARQESFWPVPTVATRQLLVAITRIAACCRA
jgi:hypothetical protein